MRVCFAAYAWTLEKSLQELDPQASVPGLITPRAQTTSGSEE